MSVTDAIFVSGWVCEWVSWLWVLSGYVGTDAIFVRGGFVSDGLCR